MYELNQGSKRLARALKMIQDDHATISRIATLLNYIPSQLEEDISAIYDKVHEQKPDEEE